jgi:hypothetical protein
MKVWVQKLVQTGAAPRAQLAPLLGTLPASENAVWLPPVTPSFGWLPARESW